MLERLTRLQTAGAISRVGAVVQPHAAGRSTLAAMAVPADRLEEVATRVSGFAEVNHNYEREHRAQPLVRGRRLVARAGRRGPGRDRRARPGSTVLDLPLEEAYQLDLGFPLSWT